MLIFVVFLWLMVASLASTSMVSPFNGTDLSHPISLLKCGNQTRCVQPSLQLEKHYKVYYCKHVSAGVRFYFLVREGLLHHPHIDLVESPAEADVVVYLPESARWKKSECGDRSLMKKMVVLDEGDGPDLFTLDGLVHGGAKEWLLYFKRSFVKRRDGKFVGYMPYLLKHSAVLPMTYTIADAYVRPKFNFLKNRRYEVVTTLRGHAADPVRARVRGYVEEYCKARALGKKCILGQVNGASRRTVDGNYLESMYQGKIVVTSNPSHWEGDFRLMEAIASGALIMVDTMRAQTSPSSPRPHLIYYDNHNKSDLWAKLDHYRDNADEARRVAITGYLHCMKYHRAVNLVDYIFRTVHLKQLRHTGRAEGGNNLTPGATGKKYSGTGFHMRNKAKNYDATVHNVHAWL